MAHGVRLSDVKREVADGTCVILSTEFDVAGFGDNWAEAETDFIDRARDFHEHLARLDKAGDITGGERRTLALLGPRLRKIRGGESDH